LASYTYTPPLPQGVGQPFQLGASSHVFDVALSRQGIWALTDHDLVLLLPDGRTVSRGLPAAELPPIYTSGAARLVVDQPANLIWVVVAGQNGGRVIGYRMARQDRVADVATPPINGAAAMGGRLYLTSDDRVLAVATTGSITRVARLPVTLGMVTADPARDRLLVLDHAHRASVWPISRSPSGRMQVGRPVRLLVYPTGLVVADGQIWVGGFDDGDGSLFRVDPARLRLLPHSVDRKAFGTGALPVAGGDSVVWVRDAQGTEMHCLDARTGRDLQDWSIDGPVASHTGLAVVASSAGLLPLRLSECRG
jgi:outer membrane protein assembly factor BamB